MSALLPNFLIVGAAKSGTTALYGSLSKHPQVFFPEIKEPSFFVAENVRDRIPTWVDSLAEYESLFSGSETFAARGEASVLYLYFFNTAIPNILNYLGSKTKIIICLRNPVDRAYSAYFDSQRFDSMENLPFEQALNQEKARISDNRFSPMTHYKAMGCYSSMVSAYKDVFSEVKVILFEDLVVQGAVVMNDLCEFLGVAPNQSSVDAANMGGAVLVKPPCRTNDETCGAPVDKTNTKWRRA